MHKRFCALAEALVFLAALILLVLPGGDADDIR